MLNDGEKLRLEWHSSSLVDSPDYPLARYVTDFRTSDVHSMYWAQHMGTFGRVQLVDTFESINVKRYVRAGNLGRIMVFNC